MNKSVNDFLLELKTKEKIFFGALLFLASPFVMNAILYVPGITLLVDTVEKYISDTPLSFLIFVCWIFLSFIPAWIFIWKANAESTGAAATIGLLSVIGIPYGLIVAAICQCQFDKCAKIDFYI